MLPCQYSIPILTRLWLSGLSSGNYDFMSRLTFEDLPMPFRILPIPSEQRILRISDGV